MYPTLVVILVSSRRSVLERTTGTTQVEEIHVSPNLRAEKRGCIHCAHCTSIATRSWPDNSDAGETSMQSRLGDSLVGRIQGTDMLDPGNKRRGLHAIGEQAHDVESYELRSRATSE